jgi:hypothetical protein
MKPRFSLFLRVLYTRQLLFAQKTRMGYGAADWSSCSLTFGLDAQNIFNDVNAGPPVGILTSPQFGHSISLNSPYGGSANANRVIRLQAFFSF